MTRSIAPRPEAPYWRSPALLFVVAAGIFATVAFVAKDPVLLFLALPLLLAPAAASLQSPRAPAPTRLEWVAAGSTAEVTIRGGVETGSVAPESIDTTFYRPEPLREERPPDIVRGSRSLAFTLHWTAPYPCLVTVRPPVLRWRDPLGLLERRLPVDGPSLHVERFPPEVARIGTVRLRRTTPLPGEVRSRAVGSGGEFFAVRLSQPGDTPRQVNWKASQRVGRRMANDFLLDRTGDLLILLDLRPTSLGPERDAKLLSISGAAALGIATGFLSEKSRVGLGLFDEFLSAVPLGTGRLQRYRILRALQRARVTENPGPSERFAVSLRRYFPPGVATLLISSLADESSIVLLSHLRRRGFPAFALSPSPLPLLAAARGRRVGDEALTTRLLSLVRRHRVAEVWREAPVVEWGDYWSLAPLVRFLTTPVRNPRSA